MFGRDLEQCHNQITQMLKHELKILNKPKSNTCYSLDDRLTGVLKSGILGLGTCPQALDKFPTFLKV